MPFNKCISTDIFYKKVNILDKPVNVIRLENKDFAVLVEFTSVVSDVFKPLDACCTYNNIIIIL